MRRGGRARGRAWLRGDDPRDRDRDRDRERGRDDGGGGPTVVDLAGHRAPGTPRSFEFRRCPSSSCGGCRAGTDRPGGGARGRYYLRSVAKRAPAHLPSRSRRSPPPHPGAVVPGDGDGAGTGTGTGRCPEGAYLAACCEWPPGTVWSTRHPTASRGLSAQDDALWPPDAEPFLYVEGSSSGVDDIDPDGDAPARFDIRRGVARAAVIDSNPGALSSRRSSTTLSHPPGADGASVNVFGGVSSNTIPGIFSNKDPRGEARGELASALPRAAAKILREARHSDTRRAAGDGTRRHMTPRTRRSRGDESRANRRCDERRSARDDSTTVSRVGR